MFQMFLTVLLFLCRFPKDAVVLLLLLIYFPVGICLMFIRIFIGIHVFLVSCALPESFVRRQVLKRFLVTYFTVSGNQNCSSVVICVSNNNVCYTNLEVRYYKG